MQSIPRALLCAVGVWVLLFAVAMAAFPLRELERPLFESIMPIALALAAVIFASVYFRGSDRAGLQEGMYLGLMFASVSILIDLPLFSSGPMAMSLAEYVKDIAVTYLLLPVITSGMAYASQAAQPRQHSKQAGLGQAAQ
jgi:hypothetical protein